MVFVLQQPVLVGGDFKEAVAALVEVALAQTGEQLIFAQGTDGVKVQGVGFLQRHIYMFQRRHPVFQRPAKGEVFAVNAGFIAL